MNIKLTIKNAFVKQTGDSIEITSNAAKQVVDIEVTGTKTSTQQERRIYIHDKDEQTKIWMC